MVGFMPFIIFFYEADSISFDEPNLKATFGFAITVPESYTALSNQPEQSSESLPNGLKKVTFVKSPKMSTYVSLWYPSLHIFNIANWCNQLYAWACGDFDYIETFTERKYNGKNLPVRVYTTKGLVEQGRFALENTAKVVDYFSEVFRRHTYWWKNVY